MLNTYHPHQKKKRLELTPREYRELRIAACKRAHRHCEICQRFAPLDNTNFTPAGHFHHIKTRAAGGDDTLENGQWVCWKCHNRLDGPQFSKTGIGI